MYYKIISNWLNQSFLVLATMATGVSFCQALDVKVTGVPGSGKTTWVFNATEDEVGSNFSTRLQPINPASIGGSRLINEFVHQSQEVSGEIVHGNPARQGSNAKGFIITGGVRISGEAYGLETNGDRDDFIVNTIAFDNNTKTVRVSQGFHVINGERIEVFKDVEEPDRKDSFIWGISRAKTFTGREKIIFNDYTLEFDIDITSFGEKETRIYVSGDKFSVSSNVNGRLPLTMSFEAVGPPTPIADLICYDHKNTRLLLSAASTTLDTQETETTKAYTFRFENTGQLGLDIQSVTIEGANADEFSLVLPDISNDVDIVTNGSLDYVINFNPKGASGVRNVTIKVESNDLYTPIFRFTISALGLSRTTDQDGDNLSDWAEFSLQDLGFDYTTNQQDLVDALLNNAEAAGLVNVGSVVGVKGDINIIEVDNDSNTAELVIELSNSIDLKTFTPLRLLAGNLRIDEDGKLRYSIDTTAGTSFFRAKLK